MNDSRFKSDYYKGIEGTKAADKDIQQRMYHSLNKNEEIVPGIHHHVESVNPTLREINANYKNS
jgi:hypothetical protein